MKEKAVIVSQNGEFRRGENSLNLLKTDEDSVKKLKELLQREHLSENVEMRVSDLEGVMYEVFSAFKNIRAAGGYVINNQGELLVIKRRGVWDLPKGKIETGEESKAAAIREVEEECGVRGLTIESAPFSTFHIYREAGETIIKESIWFRMNCDYSGELIPQIEEGITEVVWLPLPIDCGFETYLSIREVIDHFSGKTGDSGSSTVGG